jgi:hypothetical protein
MGGAAGDAGTSTTSSPTLLITNGTVTAAREHPPSLSSGNQRRVAFGHRMGCVPEKSFPPWGRD